MAIPSYFKKIFREYVTGVGSSEVADQAPVDQVNGKTGNVTINVPVDKVNGKTGDVTLSASDVNALADTYSAPVQSVNSKTGDVTVSGAQPAAVVQTYDDLPLSNVTERQLYYVDNATDGDFVYPTQISPDPVRWVSLSDYTVVASAIPDSAIAHYDAQSAFGSTSDGTTVSSWQDGLGSYDATGGSPNVVSNGINGYTSVEWDTTDDVLDVAFSAVSQPFTVFVVYQHNQTPDDDRCVFDSEDTDNRSSIFEGTGASDENQINAGANLQGSATDNSPVLLTAVFDGGNSLIRENGAEVGSGNAGTDPLNGITLGNYHQGGFAFGGYIGEVVPCSDRVSSAIISEVESRLSDKWGITL
jgi:hypothetical protein